MLLTNLHSIATHQDYVLLRDYEIKVEEKGVRNHCLSHLVTRVAIGIDVLARLQQQIQQVLVGLRDARQEKRKE